MNRETRRLMEREERRQKKEQKEGGKAGRAAAASRRAQQGEKQPFWKRIANFLHEVRVEMRKVSWPTREQMIAFSAVTLITSFALTLIIFGLDFSLKETVLFIIGGGGG